jgi:alkyldihydroxyacetonephosphate synthase
MLTELAKGKELSWVKELSKEDIFKMLGNADLGPSRVKCALLGMKVLKTGVYGYLGTKYGSIGSQLLGVEAALADGRILKTRPAQFSSTGFDLRRLFIGTEGMFGLVTSAVVRAFPKPEDFALLAYSFPGFKEGYQAIWEMRAKGVSPCMVDYGEENPAQGNGALLNLAFDGFSGEVKAQIEKASEIVQRNEGKNLGEQAAKDFWDHRHDIALMYSRRISKKIPDEDPKTKYDYVHLSMPASRMLEMYEETLRLARDGGVKVLEAGLWHGPELMSLVLSSTSPNPRIAADRLWNTSNRIIRRAQDLGGCMEFCHGVGLKLAHLMEREHGLGLEIMRRLKTAVDPLGIMNPGKAGL